MNDLARCPAIPEIVPKVLEMAKGRKPFRVARPLAAENGLRSALFLRRSIYCDAFKQARAGFIKGAQI